MKSAPLLIQSLILIPNALLPKGIQNQDIIDLSDDLPETYFTPGSAGLESNQKNSPAGVYWEHELAFSFPGMITQELSKKFNISGAVVLKTKEGRTIVFYTNDYFSNSKIRPEIVSGPAKTSVKYSITTLENL